MRIAFLLLCLAVTNTAVAQSAHGGRDVERYISATAQSNGTLLIVASSGRRITLAKHSIESFHQTGWEQVRIAPDGSAVGALATYDTCCNSYDLSLAVVVYANRREHRFTGSTEPVFEWTFVDGAKAVAFKQSTAHSVQREHYELRDVASERLLGRYDVFSDERVASPTAEPEWVRAATASFLEHRDGK